MKTSQKLTTDCFKDFGYRNSDIDKWLPKEHPAQDCEITIIKPETDMTFLEMAQKYLGTTDPKEIKKHCLTLPMVEEMIKNADTNGMVTNGYGNFFFTEDGDGSVSVGHVDRVGSRWGARVFRLDYGGRWGADDRLLVCNLSGASTLEPLDTKHCKCVQEYIDSLPDSKSKGDYYCGRSNV